MSFLAMLRRYHAAYALPRMRHCAFCDNAIARFLPYRSGSCDTPALIRVLAMVGSDVDNFLCPRCGAHDRERHLLLYLQTSGLLAAMRDSSILHFAPEPNLANRIARVEPARYVKCDLRPTAPDVLAIDMLDIPFAAESFDFVIANHVLEHVGDDLRAIGELRRVLKVGGHAILQTPYSAVLHHTWEDDGILDEAVRLQAHGQEDHVRLYGRDIFDRICSAGLKSLVQTHAQLLGGIDARRAGVNPNEPYFLFQRQ
jgi:SAM-dependent methyltransferase